MEEKISDGSQGEESGSCSNREESAGLNDKSKSLVLVNHFKTIPVKELSCIDNSEDLNDMLKTCFAAAGNRWANFVAVDYYKVSKTFLTFSVSNYRIFYS